MNLRRSCSVFWNIVIIIFLIIMIYPIIQMKALQQQRYFFIRSLERKRGSRVIVLIHRQEEMSFFGFPIARYINIEDSEKILRAIHLTNKNIPIDLILHTPGGIVLAAEQIARAIKKHPAKVTVFIPHYSMSGGSLIALAADEVVMDPNAVIGPVDPQIGTMHSQYPAVSVLRALEIPNPNRDDETLILGDIARKAINQVYQVVYDLVKDKVEEEKAKKLADILSTGIWTHDFPITVELAQEMGLPVRIGIPQEIYDLMELYPQTQQNRPTVEFIPGPYRKPEKKGS